MRFFSIVLLFLFASLASAQEKRSKTIVYFDTDQWLLTNKHKQIIDSLSDYLTTQSVDSIFINGYTDNIGDSLYNLRLSEKRSNSIAQYFKIKLPNAKYLQNFYGLSYPASNNSTAATRALNRRVEIEWHSQNSAKPSLYIKDLKEFHKLIAPKPQEYCINNNRDTVIQGNEGTIIYIKANSFETYNSSPECIRITLKERYKKSSIIRDNLTTLSQYNQILVSQSMFELNANYPLKQNINLITMTPSDSVVNEIETFYGERDMDEVLHWLQSPDQPLNVNGGELNGTTNGPCIKDSIIIKDSIVYDTVNGRCPLLFCKVFDWTGIKKYTPKVSSDTTFSTFVRKDTVPCPFPPQMRSYFPDTLSLNRVANLPKDSLKYYVFNTNRLGWRNLDWLMKIKDKVDYKVYLEPEKNIEIKLIFKEYRSVVPLMRSGNSYHFPESPLGYSAWLLAFKIHEGKVYFLLADVMIDNNGFSDVRFEPIEIEELYNKLKVFDK